MKAEFVQPKQDRDVRITLKESECEEIKDIMNSLTTKVLLGVFGNERYNQIITRLWFTLNNLGINDVSQTQ